MVQESAVYELERVRQSLAYWRALAAEGQPEAAYCVQRLSCCEAALQDAIDQGEEG